MRLNSIEIQNFRCFESYEMDFPKRFTLLIGENASGKTALLDAISKLLDTFVYETRIADRAVFEPDDQRLETFQIGETLVDTPVLKNTKVTGMLQFDSLRGGVSLKQSSSRALGHWVSENFEAQQLLSLASTDSSVVLPLVSYFGTGRLWRHLPPSAIEGRLTRFDAYRDALNSAASSKRFFRWLEQTEMAALQKGPRATLEAVREAVSTMVPGAQSVRWDFDWKEPIIQLNGALNREFPFKMLSDGYRNLLAMAADIAIRMAILNPQLLGEVVRETPGVVLIDELDLHLHPKWQRQVIPLLMRTFPKVQFIATTHSPFLIASTYDEPDCAVWDIAERRYESVPSSSIEDVAEINQGVEMPQQSQRYLDMMDAAEAYYHELERMGDPDSPTVLELKDKLDELSIPFSDDPAYQAWLKVARERRQNNASMVAEREPISEEQIVAGPDDRGLELE